MRRLLVIAAGLLLLVGPAAAQSYRVGTIEVADPWARATPASATVTAAYMRITNHGPGPDRLMAIRCEKVGNSEILEMSLADNVMRLRTVARGMEIKPGQTIEFRPGFAWQAVFAGLEVPLRTGDRMSAVLTFERAGAVAVDFTVQPIGTGLRRASVATTEPAGP
jgi:periplasmic copper chaperone A